MIRCEHCNKPLNTYHWRNPSGVIVKTDYLHQHNNTGWCRQPGGAITKAEPRKPIR